MRSLIILVAWAGYWLARAPMRPVPTALTVVQRRLGWLLVLAVLIGSVAILTVRGFAPGLTLEATAFQAVTGSMGLTALAVLLLCLAWPGYQTDPD